jgi:hypothetical protein
VVARGDALTPLPFKRSFLSPRLPLKEGIMSKRSKAIFSSIAVPVIVGSIGFINLTNRPRFQAFHTVDVIQLLATGMCYGVALAGIFVLVHKGPRQ